MLPSISFWHDTDAGLEKKVGCRDAPVHEAGVSSHRSTGLGSAWAEGFPASAVFSGANGRIAFSGEPGNGTAEIYVMNADASEQTRLDMHDQSSEVGSQKRREKLP